MLRFIRVPVCIHVWYGASGSGAFPALYAYACIRFISKLSQLAAV